MDLFLSHSDYTSAGVFGYLRNDDDLLLCTLEHAYQTPENTYKPKLPPGGYKCVRGIHKLAGMEQPFETFEVTEIFGHTGILFHVGNFNADSHGCILLGTDKDPIQIFNSRVAFGIFMKFMDGISEFNLSVI